MRLTLLAFILTVLAFQSTAQYHYYFGNIHAHTAYSDGTKDDANATPGSSYRYAKSSYHMDFLGIAEHNHYSSYQNPGMHVADYSKGLYQADTANQNGYFVCMFGMEYGVISNGGHVIVYGIPGLIGWETGSGSWGASNNYNIYNSKYDYTSLWKIINNHPNAFATLAHPQNNDYNNMLEGSYDASADSAVVGCAIRSGSAFSTTNNYSDNPATLYQNKYFLALSKGFFLGPTIDHDNHYTTFGRTSHSRTVVLARELNRDSIIAAYKARRFYASDDWDAEVTFLANGHVMGEKGITSGSTQITISISDPGNNNGGPDNTSKIELYYGIPGSGNLPTVLSTNTGSNSLTFTHTTSNNESYYYFAKITQTDGDQIWTAPIWLKTDTDAPTGVADVPTFAHPQSLELFPNPVSDQLHINLTAENAGEVRIKVYNMLGREVYSAPLQLAQGRNLQSFSVKDLPAGMYMLIISEKNSRIAESRFIKN